MKPYHNVHLTKTERKDKSPNEIDQLRMLKWCKQVGLFKCPECSQLVTATGKAVDNVPNWLDVASLPEGPMHKGCIVEGVEK